jgi:polygalacturonase
VAPAASRTGHVVTHCLAARVSVCWLHGSGPFNLSSNTVLRVEGTISGSRDPSVYPIVTQQPLDEAYRAPYMLNRQRQALISAYSARNISVVGSGTVDGNGWDWWYGVSHDPNGTYNRMVCRPSKSGAAPTAAACQIQRPKLLEFVDCEDVVIAGTAAVDDQVLTFKNSPFWTLHPTFCVGVRMANLSVLAPRDHGNTDGVDPDSCDDVHVSDVLIDVGDDAVSVKAGLHWKTKKKVAAQNYLFERVTILHRNFAIGSDVSGDVINITFRDSTIGDDLGSSPWAIKVRKRKRLLSFPFPSDPPRIKSTCLSYQTGSAQTHRMGIELTKNDPRCFALSHVM